MKTTNYFYLFFVALLAALVLTGCNRAEGPTSQIVIKFPNKPQFISSLKTAAKVSALTVVDYNLLCFAVNVKGPKISVTNNSCDVERGISMGSVLPDVEMIVPNVPTGSDISFEIYGLLRNNSAEPCPPVDKMQWNHPVNKIYLLGQTVGITLTKIEEEVIVYLSMPAQFAPISVANSFPAACTAISVVRPENIFLGSSLLTSASFNLRSRVSYKEESTELSGTTLKIRNGKAGTAP